LQALGWHLHRPRLGIDRCAELLSKAMNCTTGDPSQHQPRVRALRRADAPTCCVPRAARTTSSCTRVPCVPATRCAYLQTKRFVHTRPRRQARRPHVPAADRVRRSLSKVDRLPVEPARRKPAVEPLLMLHHLLRNTPAVCNQRPSVVDPQPRCAPAGLLRPCRGKAASHSSRHHRS
jgi:hypothetical protein